MRVVVEVNEERIHKCQYCKSIFAYEAKDIDHFWNDTVKCPICNSEIEISIFDKKVEK